jgi:hypothetical protein
MFDTILLTLSNLTIMTIILSQKLCSYRYWDTRHNPDIFCMLNIYYAGCH